MSKCRRRAGVHADLRMRVSDSKRCRQVGSKCIQTYCHLANRAGVCSEVLRVVSNADVAEKVC